MSARPRTQESAPGKADPAPRTARRRSPAPPKASAEPPRGMPASVRGSASPMLTVGFALMSVVPILAAVALATARSAPDLGLLGRSGVTVVLMLVSAVSGFLFLRQEIHRILREARSGPADAAERPPSRSADDDLKRITSTIQGITRQLEERTDAAVRSTDRLRGGLHHVAHAIQAARSTDDLLDEIVEGALQAVDGRTAYLMGVDEEEGDFVAIAAVGENAATARGAKIPLGEGVPGLTARERRPLLLCDVDTAQMEGMPKAPECTIAVPMFAGEMLHGVLIVEDRAGGGKFTQDDLGVIANLATLSSAALRQHESNGRIETMLEEVLKVFASVVEMRDPYSRGHAIRVARYCEEMARALHLDADTIGTLRRAAFIHDLGKIAIPETLLRKEGKYTEEEAKHVRNHVSQAERLLLDLPELAPLAPIVRHHHERCDGSGYPDGLKGDEIPLTTHILIVANAYDVITSDRSYRQAASVKDALKELQAKTGTWYDSRAVEALVGLDEKLLKATGDMSGPSDSESVKERGAASISIRD